MIVDKIENAQLYYSISPRIKKALEFLGQLDGELEGKIEIDGSNVFAIPAAYTSKPLSQSVWEAHRNYIDVQYIVSGNECIGYEHIDDLKITQEYDEETDCLLLEGDGNMVKCGSGTFMILYPEDAHMPGTMDLEPCDMKKVIVKVRV